MKWSDLTKPPAVRRSPAKHPLFTKSFFSTKSFGPGHLVGAGILVFGIVGISKLFIARGHERAERSRSPKLPDRQPTLATVENDRGQYGRKP